MRAVKASLAIPLKLRVASRHLVEGVGWPLRMIVKSLRRVYCRCGAGVAVKMGLRRTLLSSP